MLGNQFYYKKDRTYNINSNIYFSGFIGPYRAKVPKTYLPFKPRLPFETHNIYFIEFSFQFFECLLLISEVPGFGYLD
jgi:hypothetical protein